MRKQAKQQALLWELTEEQKRADEARELTYRLRNGADGYERGKNLEQASLLRDAAEMIERLSSIAA